MAMALSTRRVSAREEKREGGGNGVYRGGDGGSRRSNEKA